VILPLLPLVLQKESRKTVMMMRERRNRRSLFSRLDSAKDQSGLGMLSPTGVILDDYAIPEEELIPLGESVLDTTMIYIGTIQPNASKEWHRRKIQKWDKKECKALGIFLCSLSTPLLSTIGLETSPRKVYLAMSKRFCPQTQAYVFGLLRASRDQCMKPGDSIQSYIDKANDIASKLRSMGVDLGRVQLVLQIIDGLTDDYRQIRSSLNCLRDLKDEHGMVNCLTTTGRGVQQKRAPNPALYNRGSTSSSCKSWSRSRMARKQE